MPRTPDAWRTFVEQIPARLAPVFAAARLRPVPPLKAVPASVLLLEYDLSGRRILLGVAGTGAVETAADLLGVPVGHDLDRLLDLLIERLTLQALGRHLRLSQGTATNDEWLETQVANAVAFAVTAGTFEPHRSFLLESLGRAIQNLQQRQMLALPGDLAGTPVGERLLQQLHWFYADAQRTDVPDLEGTLGALVAPAGTADRKRAESEVVLLQTLNEGAPALRRTAAELFAEEASAEAIAKLLAARRTLPADVRLTLAQALIERGSGPAANAQLLELATQAGVAPPIAAAAALVLDEPPPTIDVVRMLTELEESGLAEALRAIRALPTAAGFTVVWPLLSHPAAAVRKEAYRLLANILPESDAWTGIADPEPSIRVASIPRLSERPGLPRALAGLLLDEAATVRQAAIRRARAADPLGAEVGRLLFERDTDEGRMAGAAVVAHRAAEWSVHTLAGVFARTLRPFLVAAASTGIGTPANQHLVVANKLASDALQRRRRELIAFAAEAFGRADWLSLLDVAQARQGSEAEEAFRVLAGVLPRGWYEILFQSTEPFDPLSTLGELALNHPEPLVRAALLLWLLRSGHESPEQVAAMAARDASPAVTEIIALTREDLESPMALTAIEKALFLRTVPLFRSVPTQNLLAIAGAMVPMSHAQGEAIVKQGDLGDRLFVLYQGHAQAVRTEGGEQKGLATLEPGAVFGEMSLFDLEPRSASVVAREPCETLVLDGQSFHKLGVQFPEILWEVCRVLSQRLRTTDQVLAGRAA